MEINGEISLFKSEIKLPEKEGNVWRNSEVEADENPDYYFSSLLLPASQSRGVLLFKVMGGGET